MTPSTSSKIEGNGDCVTDGSFFRSQKQENASSTSTQTVGNAQTDDVNLSEDDHRLLDQCIQDGKRKARNVTHSPSIGSNGFNSLESEKNFGSLKTSKHTELIKQSKPDLLHGSSSHEIGLNDKAMNVRIQTAVKSSSDRSYNQRVAELSQ